MPSFHELTLSDRVKRAENAVKELDNYRSGRQEVDAQHLNDDVSGVRDELNDIKEGLAENLVYQGQFQRCVLALMDIEITDAMIGGGNGHASTAAVPAVLFTRVEISRHNRAVKNLLGLYERRLPSRRLQSTMSRKSRNR
ncbi:hypothetical protein Tdes44962_MAKER00656 [Teratosphaeria destructans]|uniref:Uncharacterized protein n=1 Tax=Teratosphaeria destructans TaxID=418781 RepID=A0A9W7W0L0_9PEZI|nr:hypothetical protein Tdes44962_MAKER00656 [Teratosphaeria destructans]